MIADSNSTCVNGLVFIVFIFIFIFAFAPRIIIASVYFYVEPFMDISFGISIMIRSTLENCLFIFSSKRRRGKRRDRTSRRGEIGPVPVIE